MGLGSGLGFGLGFGLEQVALSPGCAASWSRPLRTYRAESCASHARHRRRRRCRHRRRRRHRRFHRVDCCFAGRSTRGRDGRRNCLCARPRAGAPCGRVRVRVRIRRRPRVRVRVSGRALREGLAHDSSSARVMGMPRAKRAMAMLSSMSTCQGVPGGTRERQGVPGGGGRGCHQRVTGM